MNLWRRGEPETVESVPFRCKSWRCPDCRALVGSIDYARVACALEARGPWIYAVLTAPPGIRRLPLWARYKALGDRWDKALRHRLLRRYGRAPLYVQTWESHRDGTPHVNLVLGGEALLEHVDGLGDGAESWHPRLRRRVKVPKWRAWWRAQAVACGFGPIVWVERLWDPGERSPRPAAGLAAYMVKLAHTLSTGPLEPGSTLSAELASELVHAAAKDQTPLTAPKGFRRLRASHRLLPPRRKRPDWTGALGDAREAPWSGDTVAAAGGDIEGAWRAFRALKDSGLPVPLVVSRLLAYAQGTQVPAAGEDGPL